jgi:hypothetical protein
MGLRNIFKLLLELLNPFAEANYRFAPLIYSVAERILWFVMLI